MATNPPATRPLGATGAASAKKLIGQLLLYYLVIAAAVFLALTIWPDLRGYLPVGGVETLITQPNQNPLEGIDAIRSEHVGNLGQSLFWLVVAIIGAFLCALPVTWVYMSVRSGAEYDQSLVNTILILPIVVTGIVIWPFRSPASPARCGSGTRSRAPETPSSSSWQSESVCRPALVQSSSRPWSASR
jgi:hypothetical protein